MIGQKIEINGHYDERGLLMAINHIPFEAKRMFIISDVPEGGIRGNHFSKTVDSYMWSSSGCRVELDNGFHSGIYELNTGDGLLFQKNTWMELYAFRKGTIFCIISDNTCRSSGYLSDYKIFKRVVREENV